MLSVCRGPILDAAVTVEDQSIGRSATAVNHVQRRKNELGVNAIGECIAYDLSGTQILHDSQV